MIIMDVVIYCGSIAVAVTAIGILFGKLFSKLKKMAKTYENIQLHTEENYLNNLRLVIMSDEMPIEERLRAGEKYVNAGGNGQVKAFYSKLQNDYLIKKA